MLTTLFSLLIAMSSMAEDIILYPGYSSSIGLPAVGSVAIERKGIIRIKEKPRSLTLIGQKRGETAIFLGKKKILIKVISKRNFKTYTHLKKWLKGKLGPQILIVRGEPVVSGNIYTLRDWQDLSKHTAHNDDFHVTAKISPTIQEQISSELKKLATQNGLPFPEFQTQPIWTLAVEQSADKTLKLYRDLFKPYGLMIKHSPFSLSSAPMIEVNILVTEIKRSQLLNLGIRWPTSAQANLVPRLDWANPETLLIQADAFEQNGLGKVLASPTLIAKSGEEATFHSGGEMPIKTSTQFNANVLWKRYGILLKIKPKADFSGKILIDIDCEVSMIDHSTAIDGVPGLLTNRIASHFNLQKSQTIAISGLIKEEWGKRTEGLPGLQHIPILGHLFSSNSYQNQKSELLFFVTPKVVYQ